MWYLPPPPLIWLGTLRVPASLGVEVAGTEGAGIHHGWENVHCREKGEKNRAHQYDVPRGEKQSGSNGLQARDTAAVFSRLFCRSSTT